MKFIQIANSNIHSLKCIFKTTNLKIIKLKFNYDVPIQYWPIEVKIKVKYEI